MLARRTKIVATLGPATDKPGVLDQLVAAGMDCARLNCSHGSTEDLRRRAREVRKAAQRAGRAIALLFDLQGPKLRLSAATTDRTVGVGETVVFAGAELPRHGGRVSVDFPGFADLVTDRSQIVIGDGVPRMLAERVRDGEVVARARTVAKIEKVEAHERLDEIIRSADGIMVARGDYGVEAGVAGVPLMQKDTIYRATQAGRVVVTATHMLESMISSPEPTRAEATDVANAIIDGTSAVMLSAETSVGAYP